jgi:hypothetical protein
MYCGETQFSKLYFDEVWNTLLTYRCVIKSHSVYNLPHQFAELVSANKGVLSNTGITSVSVYIGYGFPIGVMLHTKGL